MSVVSSRSPAQTETLQDIRKQYQLTEERDCRIGTLYLGKYFVAKVFPEDCHPVFVKAEEQFLKMNFSNTPKLERSVHLGKSTCLIMENVGPSLDEVSGPFDLDIIAMIGKMVLTFLRNFHAKGYGHFDLHLGNVTENAVINFKHACEVGEGVKEARGNYEFMAPEVLSARHPLAPEYDQSADLWSLGCILFELFTGERLLPCISENFYAHALLERFGSVDEDFSTFGAGYFKEDGQLVFKAEPLDSFEKVLSDTCAKRKISEEEFEPFKKLLAGLLKQDSFDRISAKNAFMHPFFSRVKTLSLKINEHAFLTIRNLKTGKTSYTSRLFPGSTSLHYVTVPIKNYEVEIETQTHFHKYCLRNTIALHFKSSKEKASKPTESSSSGSKTQKKKIRRKTCAPKRSSSGVETRSMKKRRLDL